MKQESDNRKAHPFKAHFPSRFLSRIAGGHILVLGVFVMVLAAGVALALAGSAKEVRAQEDVFLHQATITVAQDPDLENIVGYSNFNGAVIGQSEVDSVFGSIDSDGFEYLGTEYRIQRVFLNKRFDALIIKIAPLLGGHSGERPTVIIGDEAHPGNQSFLRLEHYSWIGVGLDWQEGDSVTFTLTLDSEASSSESQTSADFDFASMFGATMQGSDGGAIQTSAQSAAPVHEASITVEVHPGSKYFHGYSSYDDGLYRKRNEEGEMEAVASIYGSITDATFEHQGTEYEIQRVTYNWALDTLYLKVDPFFDESSNIRPALTFGGQTYHGQDTFLSLNHYIWWDDIVPLDWEVGDTVPFTLSLATVSPSDTQTQSGDDAVPDSVLNSLTGSGEPDEEEGGAQGWVGWLAGAIAVVVASVGYMAYRVLR